MGKPLKPFNREMRMQDASTPDTLGEALWYKDAVIYQVHLSRCQVGTRSAL